MCIRDSITTLAHGASAARGPVRTYTLLREYLSWLGRRIYTIKFSAHCLIGLSLCPIMFVLMIIYLRRCLGSWLSCFLSQQLCSAGTRTLSYLRIFCRSGLSHLSGSPLHDMCNLSILLRVWTAGEACTAPATFAPFYRPELRTFCLLYTSDAADE